MSVVIHDVDGSPLTPPVSWQSSSLRLSRRHAADRGPLSVDVAFDLRQWKRWLRIQNIESHQLSLVYQLGQHLFAFCLHSQYNNHTPMAFTASFRSIPCSGVWVSDA